MNENEEILIQIKISEDEIEQKILANRAAIVQLTSALTDLKKEYKNKEISAQEFAKSEQAITKQLKAARAEIKSGEKTLDDYAKSEKAAAGSLEQMRAQIGLLTPAVARLSKEEREGTEDGLKLVKNLHELTENAKLAEQSYGVFGRQVGEYGKFAQQAAEKTEVLTTAEKKHTQEVDKGKKSVTDYVKQISVLGINVGEASEAFKGGSQAFGTFAKGIFTARGALVALTAVPIVLVLSAIVSFLTKSKDGMEFLGRKTAAVTAVVDLFFTKLVNLGKAIVTAFENPGKALKDLGEIITTNLTNRVKAFSVILDALTHADLSKLRDGFIQLFTGITDAGAKMEALTEQAKRAAAAGEAIAKQAYAIADAERKLNVERAKSRAQVEKLKQASDDVTKSNVDRLSATLQAYSIENGLLQKQQALQKRKIDNIKAENALRPESKEGLDNLAEAEQRYSELAEESTTRQIELNNKLNQIRIEGQQQAAQLQVANAERALVIAREQGIKTNLELFDLEKDLLDKKLALDLVGIVKGSEAEKTLRLKYRTDLAALNLSSTISEEQRLSNVRTAELKRRLAEAKVASDEEFNLRRGLIQQAYLDEVSNANATIKNKQELNQKLLELDAQYAKDKEAIDQQQRQAELARQQSLMDVRLAQVRTGSDKEYRLLKEQRAIQLKQELDDVNKTEEEKVAIRAKYRKADADAQKEHSQKIVDDIINGLTEGTNTLTKFVDASVARQTAALDQQQEAALASAALSADARTKIEADFAKKREKLEKEAAEKRRKIASVENIINTASAVTKAFATAGPIVGAILAALAVATGIAQQVVIDNQKFEKGGLVDGPSHAQGGVKYQVGNRRIELEGGEAVINKRSTARFYPVLSAINVAGGGRAFPGFGSSVLLDAKQAIPRFQYGGITGSIDSATIANAIREGMKDVNLRIGVDEVTRKQNSVKYAEVSADS